MKDGSSFKVEFSNVYGFLLDMSLEFFLCGQILCDNIEVIVSYNQFLSFCQFKVVCYCVVNFYEDDYKNLMVICEQVDFQYQQLVEVFKYYNIFWELKVLEVSNFFFCCCFILVNCDISKIGDENCDFECNYMLIGYDGGDCCYLCYLVFMKK